MMLQSWLLRYLLLTTVATREAWAHSHEVEIGIEVAPPIHRQSPPPKESPLYDTINHEFIKREVSLERLLFERMANPAGLPTEGAAPSLRTPEPTAPSSPPRKRQDNGQIQALSAQLQSLSQSATQAISSVSSSASSAISQISQSAQSVRQSADQAVQSANQAADQANRQLSQTQSSASSAVSAANARASDQLAQSLSSMSSRISVNLASAQSSASGAVSSAQAAASQFAASQIQAAKADASGVRGDADSLVNQVRSNSVSASNVAIIVTVSIVGTAILSTVSSFFVLRYRRKRYARGEEASAGKWNLYEKPVAVRGSLSPRFPRFGRGSGSPMDNFKLPSLSPLVRPKRAQNEEQLNIGFATSDYSDQAEKSNSLTSNTQKKAGEGEGGQPPSFRLQKTNGISSATSVRLIRVGSDKGKANSDEDAQQPTTNAIPPLQVGTTNQLQEPTFVPAPSQPPTQSLSQTPAIITQPPKAKEPAPERRRVSIRPTRDVDLEIPGGRPSMGSTITSQNRLRFRDSSDVESTEPTPTSLGTAMTSLRNTNTASLRMSRPTSMQAQNNRNENDSDKTPLPRPRNAGATFATFPKVRNEPPRESMVNRGRPSLKGVTTRVKGEEERRRRALGEAESGGVESRSSVRNSRDIFNGR
ncbi:hypothetical protein F5Y19DRAFT_43230 [Xylariaceae sp. FL1651]|nr:hypothetical protein F5Y19DRAFT_43230 [Xylariaceae sp. FL1651]